MTLYFANITLAQVCWQDPRWLYSDLVSFLKGWHVVSFQTLMISQ